MTTVWDKLQMPARCECGGARTETLWLNYETQMTLHSGGIHSAKSNYDC